MNMLIEELQSLSADPRSWIVVGLMALLALYSVFAILRCPYVRGTAVISDDQVQAAQRARYNTGKRFAIMMMTGLALTLTGLFMIADGLKPTLALALLVGGVVLIQTEPPRLRIREYQAQVIARRDGPDDRLSDARYRLRHGYRELAATNLVLLVGLVVGLLAF